MLNWTAMSKSGRICLFCEANCVCVWWGRVSHVVFPIFVQYVHNFAVYLMNHDYYSLLSYVSSVWQCTNFVCPILKLIRLCNGAAALRKLHVDFLICSLICQKKKMISYAPLGSIQPLWNLKWPITDCFKRKLVKITKKRIKGSIW